jgi:hypothetical protein
MSIGENQFFCGKFLQKQNTMQNSVYKPSEDDKLKTFVVSEYGSAAEIQHSSEQAAKYAIAWSSFRLNHL